MSPRSAAGSATRFLVASASACAVVLGAGAALAANTSTLGSVEVYPNLTTFGVYADVAGDDNTNAKLWVEYRETGAANFTKGHALMKIAAGRYAGAVFFLAPGKGYDVRVVLDDADNAAKANKDQTASTRANEPAAASGATLWVDAAAGSDTNPGTTSSPLKTIQAGVNKAVAGDSVRVKPGVYRETVTPPKGGSAGKPLWIIADGPGVILDGSDATLEKPTWTNESGDLYSTPFAGPSQYIAADDVRLYDYPSLAELQSGAAGLPGGFFIGSGKLYVRLPDGGDPSTKTLHVAVRDTGFLLDTIGYVVVEGFELRYLGKTQGGVAVDVRDTHHAWVRKNQAHHMNTGFRVRRSLASENVIENNTFRDTSVWTWPWAASKAHTPEASAITIQNGRGNVVRGNQLEGSFNGIDAGAFGTTDENIAKDTDVYGNSMKQHADDGLEPEGACVNVRFWHNVVQGSLNAISVAPIEVGPTWLVRNLVTDYKAHVLKINNGSKGWILVYHTTGVPMAGVVDAQAAAPTLAFGPFVSRNNIYEGHRYVIESGLSSVNAGVDLDFDALYTDDPARFVKWMNVKYDTIATLKASNTIEMNGFQVKPSYENPAATNYDLTAGHALIDKGTPIDGINTGFVVGAGPDVGAFERGGVSPLDDATPSGGGGGVAGGGGSSGSAGAGSSAGVGGGGAGGVGTGGAGNAAGTGGAGTGGGAGKSDGGDDGGCGCRSAGRRTGSELGWLGLGMFFWARRSRRRGYAAPRGNPSNR